MNITLFIKEKLNLLSMINTLPAYLPAMEPQEKVNLKLLVLGHREVERAARVDSINIFCVSRAISDMKLSAIL